MLLLVVGLCALAGVLAWLALQANIRNASAWLPGPLALSQQLGATLGEWAIYSTTVALLVRTVHGSGKLITGIRIYFACTTVNYLLPLKPGIPLRLYLYRRLLQIPYAAGTAILLLEVVFISGLPVLLAPIALWYLRIPIEVGGYIVLGVLVAAALSTLLVRRRRRRRGLRFVYRLRRYLVRPFMRAPLQMSICALLQPLASFIYGLRLWLIMLPLGTPVALPTLWAIAVVSITAGRLSMLPMGVGALDLSLGLLLAQAGASPDAVLAAVLLNRVWVSSVPLLAGLAAAPVLRTARALARPG